MIDSKKVIQGLKCIAQQPYGNATCDGCAYFRPFTDDPECGWCDHVVIADDAIALLQQLEAMNPITEKHGVKIWPVCGACGWQLYNYPAQDYCQDCGRKINWND